MDRRESYQTSPGSESDVEAASRSVKDSEKKKPAKRMSAASRRSRKDGPQRFTYDELIEGGDCISGQPGISVRDSS